MLTFMMPAITVDNPLETVFDSLWSPFKYTWLDMSLQIEFWHWLSVGCVIHVLSTCCSLRLYLCSLGKCSEIIYMPYSLN